MIGSTRQIKVYAFDKPVDMRRSFDGLYGLVVGALGRDPLSGDLYLFVSRNRRRAKVLFWDGTGLCVFAKRLEQGCFTAPWQGKSGEVLTMTTTELQLLLEGSKLAGRLPLSPPKYVLKGVN